MAGSPVTIKVAGLSELRSALKALGPGSDRELTAALAQVVGKIAGKIKAAMPHRSGHAAGTVQGHVRALGASISIGTGGADDYVPWLDFGGRVGRRGTIVRPFIKTGRYLYPQISAARPETLAAIDAAVVKAAEQAGFTVSGHA